MKCILSIIVLLLLLTENNSAQVLKVPGNYQTIQDAINASSNGDTVLVKPGVYYENINFNGHNIVLASLYLTTGDTSYISSTIIDGTSSGSVVRFESGEDSTTMIIGFTIQNGFTSSGGGIYCNNSDPNLINLIISGNKAEDDFYAYGGGIYCTNNSNMNITNVIISENSTAGMWFTGVGGGICCMSNSRLSLANIIIIENEALIGGGGIYCDSSNISFNSVEINENNAFVGGGGIWCHSSNLSLVDVLIDGNAAKLLSGGGICCDNSNLDLINTSLIKNNAYQDGGGIYCDSSSMYISNVTIIGNEARTGGGIYCDNPILSFDVANRSNIYLNYAGAGCDLFVTNCINIIDVKVDTFTVLQPDEYYAYPIDIFTFDILHAKIEQVNQDLYVSPDGSDENSGLTINDPLLTMSYALTKILADNSNQLAIHLLNGIYSPSQTGERFPLNCKSYISLIGEDEANTILDGEEMSGILFCKNDNDFSIKEITIKNGRIPKGAGIYCDNSSPDLTNITVSGNYANGHMFSAIAQGGGIYCSYSNPRLTNVKINGNTVNSFGLGQGGGIYCSYSSPTLTNVIISNNSVLVWSGCNGGGLYCCDSSNIILQNVTISENSDEGECGGIHNENSSLELINCILWNDTPQEISGDSSSVTATYSDIQGGWIGIGNLNIGPGFADSLYQLSPDSSLCIDAGNPDKIHNDPEDPNNPGYALWPALGAIRNDMGAYGGPNATSWNLITNIKDDYTRKLNSPAEFKLAQNYPNPFNPTTIIKYSIPVTSNVTLKIYNTLGEEIQALVNEEQVAGDYEVVFSAKGGSAYGGNAYNLPSGVYFYQLQTASYTAVKKMILLR